MMHTTYNATLAVMALTSAARTDGATNGSAVDTALFDNRFRDVLFLITSATVTDGSHAVTVEESDSSGSGYAAVEDHRVLGSLPTIVAADDNVVESFGVRPTKRYVRVVVTTSGSTTGGVIGAQAVLGNGSYNPVARA